MRTDFVDWDNAGVIQLSCSFGFELESLDIKFRRVFSGDDHLDRDDTAKFFVACSIDDSHSATRQFFEQDIVAEVFAEQVAIRT